MGSADHRAETFRRELADLKRRGCNLLVVAPPDDGPLCEELLGDPAEPRERIVVETGLGRHEPGGDRVAIDAAEQDTRSATTATPGSNAGPGLDAGPDPTSEAEFDASVEDLDALGEALLAEVDRLEPVDGYEPGQLRVCLGDVAPLGEPEGREALLDFLETATARVVEESGMGHGHVTADCPIREELESLFDVTIEVCATPDARHHRWHLHEAGLDSGWIPLG